MTLAKIGVSISLTFRLGDPQMNEYAKVGITVDEIETTEPLEQQLKQTAQAIFGTYDLTYRMLDKRVTDMINPNPQDGAENG